MPIQSDPRLLPPLSSTGAASATPLTLTPTASISDYKNGGMYLNFNWKLPLWSRRDVNHVDQSFYFLLTNAGDLYFNSHHDTSVQTRFFDTLSPGFSIPIYGQLSLTPLLNITMYENKVSFNHYRAVTPTVALSYTFKWRQGMNFWRAAGYGAITTPPVPTAAGAPQAGGPQPVGPPQ
jgi:hypothetical protein